MQYHHRQLMQAILFDKIDIAKAVKRADISAGCKHHKVTARFQCAPRRNFVIDPHKNGE